METIKPVLPGAGALAKMAEWAFPVLAGRVRAYYRADKALQLNSIEEYRAGVTEETARFQELNAACWVTSRALPASLAELVSWRVLRDTDYWAQMSAATAVRRERGGDR